MESVIKEVRGNGVILSSLNLPLYFLSSSVFSADETSLLFMLKIRTKLGWNWLFWGDGDKAEDLYGAMCGALLSGPLPQAPYEVVQAN